MAEQRSDWGRRRNRIFSAFQNDPVSLVDVFGLLYAGTPYGTSTYGIGTSVHDGFAWIGMKVAATYSGYHLGIHAMDHADGVTPGDWTLSSSESEAAKAQTEQTATDVATGSEYEKWLKQYLKDAYYGSPSGSYALHIPDREFHYKKFSDGYYAFGDARIKHEGTVGVCKLVITKITIKAKVTLTDRYSFANYRSYGTTILNQPTAIGYRLEMAGFIKPFRVNGKWDKDDYYLYW